MYSSSTQINSVQNITFDTDIEGFGAEGVDEFTETWLALSPGGPEVGRRPSGAFPSAQIHGVDRCVPTQWSRRRSHMSTDIMLGSIVDWRYVVSLTMLAVSSVFRVRYSMQAVGACSNFRGARWIVGVSPLLTRRLGEGPSLAIEGLDLLTLENSQLTRASSL